MMSDSFIETVITPETQSTNQSSMVYRAFNGMEAVAQFEEDNDNPEKSGGED